MPIQTAIDSISQNQGSPFGFKNRIINGGMVIDQRNAGAGTTPTSTLYNVDRWRLTITQSSKFSVQQNQGSVTPPSGFTNYLGVTSQSAYSVLSSDYFMLMQRIEGYNVADLNWGSSTASNVTLSFWVRSSLTGTFGGAINNENADRTYPFTYTISSSNTWEQKFITIPGDKTGTWNKTNGVGIGIYFSLGSGSTYSGTAETWASANYWGGATGQTSVVGTNGATFYITGVQVEKGNQATSFDWRPYGTELQLCQRYYQAIALAPGAAVAFGLTWSTTDAAATFQLVSEMRTAPSVTLPPSGKTANTMSFLNSSGYPSTAGTNSVSQASTYKFNIYGSSYVGLAGSAQSCWLYYGSGGSTGYIRCDAEL